MNVCGGRRVNIADIVAGNALNKDSMLYECMERGRDREDEGGGSRRSIR